MANDFICNGHQPYSLVGPTGRPAVLHVAYHGALYIFGRSGHSTNTVTTQQPSRPPSKSLRSTALLATDGLEQLTGAPILREITGGARRHFPLQSH